MDTYIYIYMDIYIYIHINLSTFPTQNAKRTFRNACSERRGVFNGFMDPRSVRILFLRPAKRIHSRFDHLLKDGRALPKVTAVQEQNLQALTCTILLKPGKKRIRLWPAQRFLKPLKGFRLRPARPKAFCPNGSYQQHKATRNPRKILLISHISPSH